MLDQLNEPGQGADSDGPDLGRHREGCERRCCLLLLKLGAAGALQQLDEVGARWHGETADDVQPANCTWGEEARYGRSLGRSQRLYS